MVCVGGVCYSCLGHREGAYNPCPKWARIYRLMTESGSNVPVDVLVVVPAAAGDALSVSADGHAVDRLSILHEGP